MNNKTLFIYNSPYLFKILNEIKRNLNFEIQHIDEKQDVNFKEKDDDSIQLKIELEKLQTNDITPLEALNILNDIKKKYNI